MYWWTCGKRHPICDTDYFFLDCFFLLSLWVGLFRVVANSPNLWPVISSVTFTGINIFPLYTRKLPPINWGNTVERRDQILVFCCSLPWWDNWGGKDISEKGNFQTERDMQILFILFTWSCTWSCRLLLFLTSYQSLPWMGFGGIGFVGMEQLGGVGPPRPTIRALQAMQGQAPTNSKYNLPMGT